MKEKKAVKPRKPKAGMLTEDSGEGTGDVDLLVTCCWSWF